MQVLFQGGRKRQNISGEIFFHAPKNCNIFPTNTRSMTISTLKIRTRVLNFKIRSILYTTFFVAIDPSNQKIRLNYIIKEIKGLKIFNISYRLEF